MNIKKLIVALVAYSFLLIAMYGTRSKRKLPEKIL